MKDTLDGINIRLNITENRWMNSARLSKMKKKAEKNWTMVSVSNKQPYAYVTGLPKGGKGEKTDRETDR